MTYKIGISGHRALESADAVRNNIKSFLEQQLIKNSDVVCISALAEGADSIFAEEALKLELPLEVILPFSKDEYMKCFSGDALKNFNSLFDSAESSHSINESSIMTEQEREQSYLDCGIEVADKSDLMLLIYNGLKARGKGGTGDIVEYCKAHSINHCIIKCYRSTIERLGSESEKKADAYQLKHKRMWVWTLFLGLTAAIMFAINLSFVIQQPYLFILNSFELVCLIIGIGLFLKLENGQLKMKRITARRDAELLRTTEVYVNAGIALQPLENINLYPNYNNLEVKKELEKFNSETDYIENFKTKQIKSLLNLIRHQKEGYHEKRIEKTTQTLSLWTTLQKSLLILFVLLAIFHFALSVFSFYSGQLSEQLILINRVTLFLVIILPPILGATEAYIYFSELRKNLKDSQYMVKFFAKKKKELNASELLEEKFTVIVGQIRQKMDDENLNWCISTDSNANGKL